MTLSGTCTITVEQTNTSPLVQVSVYIDGVLFDTLVALAGVTTWTFSLDTTKYSGTVASPVNHTLTSVLYALDGTTSSSSATITIGN